jgi:hypothetical protein
MGMSELGPRAGLRVLRATVSTGYSGLSGGFATLTVLPRYVKTPVSPAQLSGDVSSAAPIASLACHPPIWSGATRGRGSCWPAWDCIQGNPQGAMHPTAN